MNKIVNSVVVKVLLETLLTVSRKITEFLKGFSPPFSFSPLRSLYVSCWACEPQITQWGYDTPWIFPLLSLRFRLECSSQISHQGSYLSKLESVLSSPTVLLCEMFGKFTNTLCLLLYWPFFISRIRWHWNKWIHIRFHAWFSKALIHQRWTFASLKLNLAMEV